MKLKKLFIAGVAIGTVMLAGCDKISLGVCKDEADHEAERCYAFGGPARFGGAFGNLDMCRVSKEIAHERCESEYELKKRLREKGER